MTSKSIRRARRRGYLGPWEQVKAGICLNCGERGPHFVPPSLGDEGFYICTPKASEPVTGLAVADPLAPPTVDRPADSPTAPLGAEEGTPS